MKTINAAKRLSDEQVENLHKVYPQLEQPGQGKVVQRFENKEEVTLEFDLDGQIYWCFSDPYSNDVWYQKTTLIEIKN